MYLNKKKTKKKKDEKIKRREKQAASNKTAVFKRDIGKNTRNDLTKEDTQKILGLINSLENNKCALMKIK